jgi:radical SAM superfamily enzyme YgiQ (UPF0313 family)
MQPVTLCSGTLADDDRIEPPLGPLYVAAALEREGLSVELRDYQLCDGADPFDGERLAWFLDGHQQVVLVSCFVDMLPVVLDATRRLKAARPDTVIVLGGPGVAARAPDLAARYGWIDGIVVGEGEETIRDWVRAWRAGRADAVAGMVRRAGGRVLLGPRRPRIRSVEEVAPPAYHLLEWPRYTGARIITTRGCPYRCTFCDVAAIWEHRSVYRDIDGAIDEMALLRDRYGKSSLSIVDDTFVLDVRRVEAFCRRLTERGGGFKWGCFARISLMTPELMALMARAGCRAVFYGIDSGSPEVLRRTVKGLDGKTVLPVLRQSAAHFEHIEVSFIWGYPYESLDDFERTIEMAGEASLLAPRVNVQIRMLSPLPNSPIYKQFQGKLLPVEPEDQRWLLLPALLLDARAGEVRRIVEGAPELFPGFYAFPTPAKQEKRARLEEVHRALAGTVGRTFFDPQLGSALAGERPDLERATLEAESSPARRIGVGLAIGYFHRLRARSADAPQGIHAPPLERRDAVEGVRE